MISQVLHTVCCNISGEAMQGKFDWTLLGVKGLNGLLEGSFHSEALENEMSFEWTRPMDTEPFI